LTVVGAEYHGILIKEGVKNQTIFDQVRVLGKKTGRKWTLLKIGVEVKNITRTVRMVQANLLIENGIPYYAHFYRDDELIVIFPERIFNASPEKSSWSELVSYGESLGIPKAELDFRPCRFKDESY
jgi:hypothetical protein